MLSRTYFETEDGALRLRPAVPIDFRRGAQEKAEAVDEEAGLSPPETTPETGLPLVHRRSLRPLIAFCILGWAVFIALGAFVRWVAL